MKSRKAQLQRQLGPWNYHVKKIRKQAEPGTKFKDILILASKTYNKKTIYSDSRIKVTKKIPNRRTTRASKKDKKKRGKRQRRSFKRHSGGGGGGRADCIRDCLF